MPDLPQYEAGGGQPPSEIRPNETGVLATAQAGYRIGRAFDQEGSDIGRSVTSSGEAFQAHVASQEKVRLMPMLAEMRAQHDAAWNTIISQPGYNPGDPTARIKYMQQVQADYQGLLGTTTTKDSRGFLQENMYRDIEAANTKTIGDTASLVAEQTVESKRQADDIGYQAVTNDPSQLSREIAANNSNTESLIADHGPTMGVEGINKVREDGHNQNSRLVFGSYSSAIQLAPDAASTDAIIAKLNNDKENGAYLNSDQMKELQDKGTSHKTALYEDQIRNRTLANDQAEDVSRAQAAQYMAVGAGVGSKTGAPDFTDPKVQNQWNVTIFGDPKLTDADKKNLYEMGRSWSTMTREQQTEGNIAQMQDMIHKSIANPGSVTDAMVYGAVGPGGLNQDQAHFVLDAMHPKSNEDPIFTKLYDADMEYVKEYYPIVPGAMTNGPAIKARNDAITYYTQRAYQLKQQGIPNDQIFAPTGPNSMYNGKTIDSWIPQVPVTGAHKGTTGQHSWDIAGALQSVLQTIAGIGPGNSYGQPVPITGGAPAVRQQQQQSDQVTASSIWGPQH